MSNANSKAVMKSQRRKKLFAIEQFGGKCQLCGYDKCIDALHFHHVDPSTKEASPSYVIMRKTWAIAYEELKKCVLVCANCHAEIHHQRRDVTFLHEAAQVFNKVCERCESVFETRKAAQKYCGVTCQGISRRRVQKEPTKSELKKLIDDKTPWVKIGEIYGVSDNAMRKWARKFELI
jgi:hypothetical protein